MMALGPYRFSLNTGSYQSLKRHSDYRWASCSRIGKDSVVQYVGKGEETLDLEGVIYPHYKGGFGQVDTMRDLAEKNVPHLLIDGQGHILGRWVIRHLEETLTAFLMDGTPRKIEFRLQLTRFGEM